MKNNSLNHIAFILDGNKRWSKKHNLKNVEGYKKGIDKIYEIIDFCYKKKIKYVSLFLLSTENIKRKNNKSFFKLAKSSFKNFLLNMEKIGNINLNIIGEEENLPSEILKLIAKLKNKDYRNNNLTVNLAFNYGFEEEIKNVILNISDYLRKNNTNIKDINLDNFFYLKNQKNPDILIRTGGYKRLSNFILKNLVYSEIYFVDSLWPDFTSKELEKIIIDYKNINRNYGL